jgi:hypothetical protein
MPEVKYRTDHHAGATAEQRIKNRLRSSSAAHGGRPQDHLAADAMTQTTPTRTHTSIHHSGSAKQHGPTEGRR